MVENTVLPDHTSKAKSERVPIPEKEETISDQPFSVSEGKADNLERSDGEKKFLDFVEGIPSSIAESGKQAISDLRGLFAGPQPEVAEVKPLSDEDLDSKINSLFDEDAFGGDDMDARLEALRTGEPFAERTVGTKILDRITGEDVDDPMPFIRMGSTITSQLGGAAAGARFGARLGARLPVVGPIIGTGVGAVAGAIAGTVVGTALPEGVLEMGEFFNVIDPEGPLAREIAGLSPQDLRIVLEGEILLEFATAGGLTLARAATKGATKIFVGAGGEEMALAKRAKARGIDLIPVQLGTRLIPRAFVVIMGKFPLIAGPLRKGAAAGEKQIEKSIKGLSARLAPFQRTADELGISMFREAKGLAKAISKDFSRRYDEVYKLAAKHNVRVVPANLNRVAAQTANRLKNKRTRIVDPKTGKVKLGPLSPVRQKVSDFITANFKGLKRTPQTLEQMDELVSSIDEFIATLEPSQKKFAIKLMTGLRTAAQRDMVTNARGVNAAEIAQRLRNIDKDFSFMLTDVMETSIAKQFGSFSKKGLRGVVSDEVTRLPVDTLTKIVKLESPEAMADLSKLLTPKLYRELTSQVLDNAVVGSMDDIAQVGKRFDVQKFKRTLGLDNVKSSKYQTLKTMLEKTGGVTIRELEDIADAAKVIEGFPIESASTFVMRRAVLGGTSAFIGALLPGITAGTAAGGVIAGFGLQSLVMVTMFLGGSRMLANAIANPNTVQALRQVMAAETTDVIRRQAYIKIARFAVEGATGDPGVLLENLGEGFSERDRREFKDGMDESWGIILDSLDNIGTDEEDQ
jgi:hypothetical protein